MYFLVVCVLILAVAAITSGIIITYNQCLSERFSGLAIPFWQQRSSTPNLPIVTQNGEIIENIDQLDAYLESLNEKLQQKANILSENKTKCQNTQDRINKLDFTKYEVKKFYNRLKTEITRSETECRELQTQINEFRKRRDHLRTELTTNPPPLDFPDISYEEVHRWINEYKQKYSASRTPSTTPEQQLAAILAATQQEFTVSETESNETDNKEPIPSGTKCWKAYLKPSESLVQKESSTETIVEKIVEETPVKVGPKWANVWSLVPQTLKNLSERRNSTHGYDNAGLPKVLTGKAVRACNSDTSLRVSFKRVS